MFQTKIAATVFNSICCAKIFLHPLDDGKNWADAFGVLRQMNTSQRASTCDIYRNSNESLGTWCSGITSASHAEGPGFKSQCVHIIVCVSCLRELCVHAMQVESVDRMCVVACTSVTKDAVRTGIKAKAVRASRTTIPNRCRLPRHPLPPSRTPPPICGLQT